VFENYLYKNEDLRRVEEGSVCVPHIAAFRELNRENTLYDSEYYIILVGGVSIRVDKESYERIRNSAHLGRPSGFR